VVFTDFRLFNETVLTRRHDASSPLERSILATEEITLGHRENFFSLGFAALSYTSPTGNRYAYKLEGFHNGWIETAADQRSATFTNLDPGRYTLRVKASNADGIWNEEGASLRIHVLPPPWETWWARSLFVLAAIAGLAWAVRSQRRKLHRERAIAARERAASDRLREADRIKDEFLANTSHELRTPLFGIIGLAQTLQQGAAGDLPETARQQLGTIVASGQRLHSLVDNLLDFSAMRRHQLELVRRPVALHALVESVLSWADPSVEDKDLTLINAVPRDLPLVEVDEARIRQVLLHLVGNAVKFTPAGEMRISARSLDEQWLEVRVSDTGIGIAPEQQARIFRAFEQADGSTERAYGGTGLGLTLSRHLVELHGGELRVESVAGAGATFVLTLPVTHRDNDRG
jgi:signal transduction histidine kinase